MKIFITLKTIFIIKKRKTGIFWDNFKVAKEIE